MDDLNKKAKKGLEEFKERGGNWDATRSALDARLDDLLGADSSVGAHISEARPARKYTWLLFLLLILIGLALAVFWPGEPEEEVLPNDIFAAYYEPFPNILDNRMRGGAEAVKPFENQAMSFYNAGAFQDALDAFQEVSTLTDTLQFYKGICALEIGMAELAITQFSPLLNRANFILADATAWYLALAYLSAEDLPSATKLLEQISREEDHYKREEAQQLRQMLPR